MKPGPRFALPLPPATRCLFLLNVAVFVANALLLGRLSEPGRGGWFAFSWPGLLDAGGLGLLRVVSYQFTHAFTDPLHLLTNMLALWVFGPMVEARLGAGGTARLYLWGGLAGALGHLLLGVVQGHLGVALVGASGACYALMLYAACVQPRATIVFFVVQMPLWGLAALLVGLGVYQTFVELATGSAGGVAHSAHLGGGALGYAAWRGGWFGPARHRDGTFARWLETLRTTAGRRRRAAAAARAERLDAILAKVKVVGLSGLEPAERRFLAKASERARADDS